MEYNETNELNSSRRAELIKATFVHNLHKIYQPHKHLTEGDAVGLYLREIANIINQKLPHCPNEESFMTMLRAIWSKCTTAHDTRFFFSLALVNKMTQQVSREHYNKHVKPFEPKVSLNKKADASVGSKDNPESQGWTVEKCRKHIADTQALIDSGEIGRQMGESLISIPKIALSRILRRQGQSVAFDEL